MRIAVFGSGAVGGYFGGRLAEAGEDVQFIARGHHLTAIREQGLRVSSAEGEFLVRPARATGEPSALGTGDVVLLPADGTASMQRDIIQGRPSELESQVGAVVRLGDREGIPVPLHRLIHAALLPLERRARGELQFTVQNGAA